MKHSVILEKHHQSTIFVALVYSCPYGPAIQHANAHVIPAQLAGRL